MLYRITGKMPPNADSGGKLRTFAVRTTADNALGAVVSARKELNAKGIPDDSIIELSVRGLEGKSSVHIGVAKERKPKAAATPAAPAVASTPARGAQAGRR